MYRLFLCLHYLRSRVIAYFAVLGVALCVAMMLIVVSVMNGFLDKVEKAAKGLFGDIVVEAGAGGMSQYDEFIQELKEKVPEVQAASPFIQTFGILQVPGTVYRQIVTLAGVRLPERAAVSDFEQGLWVQKGIGEPSFDPPVSLMQQRVQDHLGLIARLERELAKGAPYSSQTAQDLAERLGRATYFSESALGALDRYAPVQPVVDRFQQELARQEAKLGAATQAGAASQGVTPEGPTAEQIEKLQQQLGELTETSGYLTNDYHAILGLGIEGLMFRTPDGQVIRFLLPGDKITLTLVPMGRRMTATVTPNTATFLVVDDARTDVASIDSSIVYLPFDTLQLLNDLGPEYGAEDNRLINPARTRQIHIKVSQNIQGEAQLRRVRDRIQDLWVDFLERCPWAGRDVEVRTWRQQQAGVVEPIETQRTLTVIMFGIISMVSVVLIFVIFYMIVFQKTKDIGVLKAVGASNSGVAWIFLAYGAAIGLVGSILGTIGGYYFVLYINQIQDAIDKWFGFRVWDREVFIFEKIPNEVQLSSALLIVAGAIAAGLIGALIPAMRAARMQPVEALRYE